MQKSEYTIFYTIEKAIKTYRQFGQRQLMENGFSTTIDQGLILNIIQASPGISQKEIAEKAFKDHASVTRIIENLVKTELLQRDFHPKDRRRFHLTLTSKGLEMLKTMEPFVISYRQKALEGISVGEIESIRQVLGKLIQNCK